MATSENFGSETMPDQKIEYLPLKMLEDKKTEMYVKFAKVMVIFQGAYTFERSCVERKVGIKFEYASRLISDETYRKECQTICMAEDTEEYYDYFRNEARKALEEANNLLVIDPTMSNVLQNRYYAALAHKMQYVILVVPPLVTGLEKQFNWPYKSQAASFREVGVYMQSATQFQHMFAAFYLHDVDSEGLRREAGLYIKDCIEDISEFKEMLSRVVIPGDEVKLNMDTETFAEKINTKYFNLDDQWQDLAYCVTKMFNNQLFSMNSYFKNEDVIKNYGKMSRLIITGFIVSPHMVAARVKLTFHQKKLWDMQDEIDENTNVPLICPSDLFNKVKAELDDVNVRCVSTKSKPSIVNCGRPTYDPTEAIPGNARGRGCHFVLGKAPGAPLRNVDFDVQFAIRRQNRIGKDKVESYNLERSVVSRFGKYWFIDLKEALFVDALFASCVMPHAYEDVLNPGPRRIVGWRK